MKAWRWNGHLFEPCDAVPLSDRGFRFGMSVFESLPVIGSQPQHLGAHLKRLRAACAVCRFPCDEEAWATADRPLREAGIDGFARIYVTAGDGDSSAPPRNSRIFIFLEPRHRPARIRYDLDLADGAHEPLLPGLKTGNYWANLDRLRAAHEHGKQETLLFNRHNELVSACCANVFLVRQGRIRTPAPGCGARPGVIRELVMQRLPVEESALSHDDVMQAEEIFLTNSWIGVAPVGTVGGRTLASHNVAASLGSL